MKKGVCSGATPARNRSARSGSFRSEALDFSFSTGAMQQSLLCSSLKVNIKGEGRPTPSPKCPARSTSGADDRKMRMCAGAFVILAHAHFGWIACMVNGFGRNELICLICACRLREPYRGASGRGRPGCSGDKPLRQHRHASESVATFPLSTKMQIGEYFLP